MSSQTAKISKAIWIPALILICLGGLYGGSYGIIQLQISKSLSTDSTTTEENNVEITDFEILDLADDFISIIITMTLEEPLMEQNIKFQLEKFTIFYNSSEVAELLIESPLLSTNQQVLTATINLTILDSQIYSWLIQEMAEKHPITLRLAGKLKLLGALAIYPPFKIDTEIDIESDDSATPEEFYDLDILLISVDPATGEYSITFNVSLHNPLPIDINIMKLSGDLYFDDLDGVLFLNSEENIELVFIDLDWEDNPFILPANATSSRVFTISDDSLNLVSASRLADEVLKERLIIDILSAEISMQITEFEISIPFELNNVYIDFS